MGFEMSLFDGNLREGFFLSYYLSSGEEGRLMNRRRVDGNVHERTVFNNLNLE
jgi:hypothetical protein